MVSLLPAIATVIGIVVLTQIPSAREVLGVLAVVAGVALHRAPRQDAGGSRKRHRKPCARRPARAQLDGVGDRGDRRQPEAEARRVRARQRAEAVVLDDDPQRGRRRSARASTRIWPGVAVAVGVQDRVGRGLGDGQADVGQAPVGDADTSGRRR